jgi:hypothetical protein
LDVEGSPRRPRMQPNRADLSMGRIVLCYCDSTV